MLLFLAEHIFGKISSVSGPKTVPFFGNLLIVLRLQPNEIVEELLKRDIYGPVARIFIAHKLAVVLYHPRDIELILNSTEHIDKSPEYRQAILYLLIQKLVFR